MYVFRNSIDNGSFPEKKENDQGCTNLQRGKQTIGQYLYSPASAKF